MPQDVIEEMQRLIADIDKQLTQPNCAFSVGQLMMIRELCEEELDMLLLENGEIDDYE